MVDARAFVIEQTLTGGEQIQYGSTLRMNKQLFRMIDSWLNLFYPWGLDFLMRMNICLLCIPLGNTWQVWKIKIVHSLFPHEAVAKKTPCTVPWILWRQEKRHPVVNKLLCSSNETALAVVNANFLHACACGGWSVADAADPQFCRHCGPSAWSFTSCHRPVFVCVCVTSPGSSNQISSVSESSY